ncbi:MAG: T9SS type A sorting domain-containing protein [Bacteroidia bacterium]
MKRLFVVVISIFLVVQFAKAQTYAQKAAVIANAQIQTDPWLAINLTWRDDALASKWTIYKKNITTGEFDQIGSVNAPDTSYTDEDVDLGESYTYLIHKENVNKVMGFALVTAGANTKRSFDLGTCLVILEEDLDAPLKNEINTLINDLYKEGWNVLFETQKSTDKPTVMKNTILNNYTNSDSTLNTVILIGDLPVAYSGEMAPDGHFPDHQGAWPTDAYYGDIDGTWTDNTVNTGTGPERSETENKIGDGKFDQNLIPGITELMVGRIDLEGYGDYETDRITLYKRYLDRNHEFRTAQFKTKEQSIVNDKFVNLVEGFAGTGYRNFPLIKGNESVGEGSLLEHALNDTLLFAYGCGAGTYTSAGVKLRDKNRVRIDSYAVTQTSDYFNYSINAVFNILFGSYFGDWDNENNLLRAPLAGNSPALATFWAGRPVWHLNDFMHGKPLGYSLHTSQNSDIYLFSDIEPGFTYEKWIHIALMGDPTLHMRNIDPIKGLKVTCNEARDEVNVTWETSAQYDGYNILGRVNHTDSVWYHLSMVDKNTNSFKDTSSLSGDLLYKVIPVKNHIGPTGSYEIFGQFDTAGIDNIKKGVSAPEVFPSTDISVFPNPANDLIIVNTSQNVEYLLITDLAGKEIMRIESNEKVNTINVSKLLPGLYNIVGIKNNQTFQKQFIITN